MHIDTKKERCMEKVIFNTAGNGLWSRTAKSVEIVDMRLGYVDEDKDFGELCVFFNTDTWDVTKDGLIYTDKLFEAELNAFLATHGLPAVSYSEQGMQGEDYVSLDAEGDFISAWEAKFGVLEIA
jgi:hypothetical protein